LQEKYRVVGQSLPRQESVLKVTGAAEYTNDIHLPGMVFGKILRSPHAHARVIAIDTAAAEALAGVLGVLTFRDVPGTLYNCSGTPPSPMVIKDEKILTGEPKHEGDRIAAVVAVSEDVCNEALSRIKVEYDILPAIMNVEEALADGAPPLHGNLFPNNVPKTVLAEEGDTNAGLQQADRVFTGVYRTPAVQHVPLEPTGCICHYTRDDRLLIWSTSQTPHHDRRILSDLTGLPQSRIRIIKPMMGGGFGARQQLHHQPVGVFLSRMIRRPVKMIYDREEEMVASTVRHGSLIKVHIGVNHDGKMVAIHVQAYLDTGGYITQGPTVLASMSRKIQYRVPHYRFEGYCVYTNTPVAGAMRGYGNPQLNFARETLMNEICEEMGWDPVRFRLNNHLQVGDKIPSLHYAVESCRIEECVAGANRIKACLEEAPVVSQSGSARRSWGVSFGSHASGIAERDQGAAAVLVNDDGTVNLLVGSPDIGQGSDTILAQIVAEELGLESTQVVTVSADTDHVPYDTGTFASRQAYVTGNAVLLASRDVRESLGERLAIIYGVGKEDIIFADKEYVLQTPAGEEVHLSFADAVKKASFGATGHVFIGRASFKPATSPPPYVVCLAQVEVDDYTGRVKVPHIIMAVDVGFALNPDIVEGQVHGGASMGAGFALCEAVRPDRKRNKTLESDLLYYKTLFTVDSPDIHVYLAEGFEPSGPYGAKSVGELPTVPVASAIIHALYNATGVWVRELPLSYTFRLGN
jgi:CO/xanthine dehydrogenase Mo-binding subunit